MNVTGQNTMTNRMMMHMMMCCIGMSCYQKRMT